MSISAFRLSLLPIVLSAITFRLKAQDYLQLQMFKLDNGFSVYLLPDPKANSSYGLVAVRAGAKNEPQDATGLAHYLEHLLFKGNNRLGTTDFQKEKIHLDSITGYYDLLARTNDKNERKKIQQLINFQEIKASNYGLPTDFDNLLKEIGSTRINAFTGFDETVYHNAFPGEQIEKWLDIYAERFRNPVFRSFQSELEVVYEEKNRSSDDFQTSLLDKFNKMLFPGHPYGERPIIGLTEHLKNPRIDRIYEFYKTWYVANNMALVVVGNFEPERTKQLIKDKFSGLPSGVLPTKFDEPAQPLKTNKEISLRATPFRLQGIGYRTVGLNHPDALTLEVIENMMNNQSETGLLDGLVQDGKLLAAFMGCEPMRTDGSAELVVIPKIIGQSFSSAEKLVLNEMERLKKGDFKEEFLERIKTELAVNQIGEFEDPIGRAMTLMQCFIHGLDWENEKNYPHRIKQISKEDVMRVAQKYFSGNRVVLKSRMGFPKKDKIEKPGFKPLRNEKKGTSAYAAGFRSIRDSDIRPKFLNYQNDVIKRDLGNGHKLFVALNPYNNLASIDFKINLGESDYTNYQPLLLALELASPKGMDLKEYKKALAGAHCSAFYDSEQNFLKINLSGEEAGIFQGFRLVAQMLQNPDISETSANIIKSRWAISIKDQKRSPSEMGRALRAFVLYGNKSEYLNRPALSEVKAFSKEDFTAMFSILKETPLSIHFCGQTNADQVADSIREQLQFKANREIRHFPKMAQSIDKPRIYLVHDKKARQSQLYFLAQGEPFKNEDAGKMALLNEYLGGGFSGLILQEIREYRSIAYSASGGFNFPDWNAASPLFASYIGCQADKTNEAVETMMNLIRKMPEYPDRIPLFKTYFGSSVSSRYPAFRSISAQIENETLRSFSETPLSTAYAQMKDISFQDMMDFYRKNLKDKPVAITIYGNKSKINLEELRKYGEIIELKASEIAKP